MSSAYGHFIEPLTREMSHDREWTCAHTTRCPGAQEREYVGYGGVIRHYRAGGTAIYMASYRYVTGRQGRTTYRELPLCQPCGERFAKNHKLELPAMVSA